MTAIVIDRGMLDALDKQLKHYRADVVALREEHAALREDNAELRRQLRQPRQKTGAELQQDWDREKGYEALYEIGAVRNGGLANRIRDYAAKRDLEVSDLRARLEAAERERDDLRLRLAALAGEVRHAD